MLRTPRAWLALLFIPALAACPGPEKGGTTPSGGSSSSRDVGEGPAVPGSLSMRGGRPAASTDVAPWKGGRRAKVVIEEFSDFECGFCARGATLVKKILAHYGDKVKVVFRHFPLKFHRYALGAAQAAVAAQAQGKFWAMHDLLFANNDSLGRSDLIGYARKIGLDVKRFTAALDNKEYEARVRGDMRLGVQRRVEATPTFFVNGRKVEGAVPFSVIKKEIDAALQ